MDSLTQTITNLPHTPGVYLYKDKQGTVLYVGKAINLSKRVRQYFGNPERLNEKTRQLVALIATIEVIPLASEFDALLLEAKLIRHYLPKYNIVSRDDKSPIYIRIPKHDPFPIVSFQRKPKDDHDTDAWHFGPFSSHKVARSILKNIRHSLPFCMQKPSRKRACFYTHLGLCNPCPSFIQSLPEGKEKKHGTAQYKRNITRLVAVLSGKSETILKAFDRDIAHFAKQERFEEAAMLQSQKNHLKEIIQKKYEPFLYDTKDSLRESPQEAADSLSAMLSTYFRDIRISRLECYDISNISGKDAVGSMVVLIGGVPDTREYRRFKIRTKTTPDDPHMMAEVLQRRLAHPEWPLPDIIVVDGGKTQVLAGKRVLQERNMHIPLCGLAKRREEIILDHQGEWVTIRLPYHNPARKLLERIRDEAHRFAITYHRKLFRAHVLSQV